MADHDELLDHAVMEIFDAVSLHLSDEAPPNAVIREELAAAVQAALATRPQLVQVGWFEDPEQAAISLKYHQSFPAESPFPDGVPIFVRQSDLLAAAGSAAPTGDSDE